MGLFSWLHGKPALVNIDDQLWMTRAAKNVGIVADLLSGGAEKRRVLLVAHFPDTLASMTQALVGAKFNLMFLGEQSTRPDATKLINDQSPGVVVALERQLRGLAPTTEGDLPTDDLRIVVAERHYLIAYDQSIERFAQEMARPCTVHYHVALDDPLVKPITSEWMIDLLRRLGMPESQRIDSPLIKRGIKRLQKKYGAKVHEIVESESAEEWLLLNAAGSN